jgi:hypothetical protein
MKKNDGYPAGRTILFFPDEDLFPVPSRAFLKI